MPGPYRRQYYQYRAYRRVLLRAGGLPYRRQYYQYRAYRKLPPPRKRPMKRKTKMQTS